ncbi:hypothetical protein, partial [Burkholderia sp. Ac-20379]|uniref:hypothetical protein n=1 Tax=Burkholderia sp. Ac-20379 TaxID=2703900 RepID=UPI00197D2EBC
AARRAGACCAQVCAPRAMIRSSPAAAARRAFVFHAGTRRGQPARRVPAQPRQAILDVSLDPARLAAMPVNEYVDLYVIQPSDTGLLSSP